MYSAPFSTGDVVKAIHKGEWYDAKIVGKDTAAYPGDETKTIPYYKVHYVGWSKQWVKNGHKILDTLAQMCQCIMDSIIL